MSPSRDILHQKALAAAASVVLALGAVACDPTKLLGEDDTAADSGDSAVADAGPDCTADTGTNLTSCCEERAQWCDDEHGEGTEAAHTCTFGPGYDGSTGCIPWGPPAPPRFRGAVA